MIDIWVSIITAIIAPTILFILQTLKDNKKNIIDDCNKKLLRLEIIMNLYHNPEDRETILNLYDEYKAKGGNSYIASRINEWSKKPRHCGD